MSETGENRNSQIVKTSIVGIITNLLLAGFKMLVGVAADSIAVISDGINNLSDAFSSLITIISAKLAGRQPDKKHPFGYGRIEYMSIMVVAGLVLYAGITSLVESVKSIINPSQPDYSTTTLIVMAVAVVVKLLLGTYVKNQGKKLNSGSLTASGYDALSDAVLTVSVLAAALVYLLWHFNVEAYLGVVISVFIIRSAVEMISEGLDEILGMRSDSKFTGAIRSTILKVPGVHGVYDLVVNNYGPDRYLASVHVEVDEHMTAEDIDEMSRRIQQKVMEENSVIITAVGIYAGGSSNPAIQQLRKKVYEQVTSYPGVLQVHGFHLIEEQKKMIFDVIIDFDVKDRHQLYQKIVTDIRQKYPEYEISVTLDSDISD